MSQHYTTRRVECRLGKPRPGSPARRNRPTLLHTGPTPRHPSAGSRCSHPASQPAHPENRAAALRRNRDGPRSATAAPVHQRLPGSTTAAPPSTTLRPIGPSVASCCTNSLGRRTMRRTRPCDGRRPNTLLNAAGVAQRSHHVRRPPATGSMRTASACCRPATAAAGHPMRVVGLWPVVPNRAVVGLRAEAGISGTLLLPNDQRPARPHPRHADGVMLGYLFGEQRRTQGGAQPGSGSQVLDRLWHAVHPAAGMAPLQLAVTGSSASANTASAGRSDTRRVDLRVAARSMLRQVGLHHFPARYLPGMDGLGQSSGHRGHRWGRWLTASRFHSLVESAPVLARLGAPLAGGRRPAASGGRRTACRNAGATGVPSSLVSQVTISWSKAAEHHHRHTL